MRGIKSEKRLSNHNAHQNRNSNSRTPGRSRKQTKTFEDFAKTDYKHYNQQTQEKHNLHQYIVTPQLIN
jgi:hypothetical protein